MPAADAAKAGERAELRYQRSARAVIHRPRVALVDACDVTPHAEAERMFLGIVEPELTEWHTEFGRPAERIDSRRDIPDAIPRIVLDHIGVYRGVAFHAGRIDRHLDTGATIVVAVDEDLDLIRIRLDVTTRQQTDDGVGMRIVGADEDVDVLRVVHDPRGGAERRGRVLGRRKLAELLDHWRGLPHQLIVAAIEHRRTLRTNGARGRRGRPRRRWRIASVRHHGERRNEQRKADTKQRHGRLDEGENQGLRCYAAPSAAVAAQ